MISEKGNIQETPFGKLLVTLFEKKVTGILYLRVGGVLKEIYLNQGKIIWSVSTADDEKLDNILIETVQLDRSNVEQMKKEHHLSSTVSFLLQEKGIVTKEQIVDAFSMQIGRIFSHILGLQEGEYNFVYGLSPKKAIDLEIEVPDCLRLAIRNIPSETIWKFLGSPQTEVRYTDIIDNEETLAMLNSDEQGMLPRVEQWTTIESLLDPASGIEPDSLLRILFMMTQCGWLDKNEVPATPADANAIMMNAPQPSDRPGIESIDFMANMDNLPEVESIDLDLPKKEMPLGLSMPPEEIDVMPKKTGKKKELSRNFPVNIPSSTKPRFSLARLLLILVVIVILGGVGAYLYFSGIIFPKNDEAIKTAPPTRQQPLQVKSNLAAVSAETKSEEKPTPSQVNATAPPATEKKPAESKLRPPLPSPANAAKKKAPVATLDIEPPSSQLSDPSALQLYESGKLADAGSAWARELKRNGFRFGILLELDCAKESVKAAYLQFREKSDFYLLNRRRDDRLCYLVLWGKFHSRDDAQSALKKIPPYFWKQADPPSVIDLAPYLD